MSVESAVAPPGRTLPATSPGSAPPAPAAFHYTQTDSFAALLQQLGASLLVSTYQANKLLVARAAGGGLSMLVRTFDRSMGLAVDARRLMIGTRGFRHPGFQGASDARNPRVLHATGESRHRGSG